MLFVSILLLYSHPHPQNYSSLSSHSGCEASGNGTCYDEKPDNPYSGGSHCFKDQSINGFCKKDRAVKGFKIIIFNHYSFSPFHHGNIFLMLQIGNLRINRDNSFRKLEHISQCVDKRLLRISTFRQAPVSNQPLQSPHSNMAVPDV